MSVLTRVIIYVSLYLTFFWVLVMINSPRDRAAPKKMKYPAVSILIPAYNEEKGIEETIKSCIGLSYPGQLKLIFINDASKDKTLQIARKYKADIQIVNLKFRHGKAAALNKGLKHVHTDYFGVVDADSRVTPTSLTKAMYPFFEDRKGEQIGATITRLKPENTSGNMLERIQLLEYLMVGLMRYLADKLRVLHITIGVLSVYRTDIVRKLGCFDPNNLTEDFELGVKIRKAGYLVAYASESRVFTRIPSKISPLLSQRVRWSRGYIQTHSKHREVFFNPRYGLFGIYQFPMNILMPVIFFLGVFTVIFHVYKGISEFLFKLIYTPKVLTWFKFGTLQQFFLGLDVKMDIMILMNIFLLLALVYGFMRLYGYNYFKNQPIKQMVACLLYILVYNYIYIYAWVASITRELRKERYAWGTKDG